MVQLNDWREYERQKFVVENGKVGLRTFEGDTRVTAFDEQLHAWRTSKFNFKPTWGTSALRDTLTETGVGASVTEVDGEFQLSTGTAASNEVAIRTKERGQYQAGAEGEAGIGVRLPTAVTGTQYWEWGYFDDNNGFGYGVDTTGIYIFRLRGGVQTKVYQSDWNKDKMDGTNDPLNPSRLTLNLADGNIFQINFVWYGYGAIRFFINVRTAEDKRDDRILVHSFSAEEEVSVIDPNQPLTIRGYNGATTDTNSNLYVGGRQFSVVDGNSTPNTRNISIELPSITASSTSYAAVAAIRKKPNFNGRENSVNCFINDIQIQSNNTAYVMVNFGGTVTDGSWVTPADLDDNETAMQVNTTLTDGNTTPFTSVDKVIVSGSASTSRSIERRERITFGQEDVAIIYVKRPTTNATLRIIIDVEEEW